MSAELTSRQRRRLRALARRLRADVIVGKDGLSESLLRHVGALLSRRELIKVRLPQGAADERRSAAQALAEAADAGLVDLIGRAVVLYRPNEQLGPDRRIQLPEP